MSLNKFTIQKSFAISAGAGSGKTYTLSRRYINALLGFDYFRENYITQESYFENLKPAKVNQIVTITYTEAAALEMRGRIFELVKKIIHLDDLGVEDGDYGSIVEANRQLNAEQKAYVKVTLTHAYTESTNSKISTIHAYCLNIIKANSDIARIDVKLDIIKEDEKANELSKIVFDVLNSEENKVKILDIAADISMFFVNNLIQKYVSSSKFRKDYDSFDAKSIGLDMYKKIIEELYPLPDVRDDFEIVKAYMLENSMENAQKYSDVLESYIHGVVHFEAEYLGVLLSEHELNIAFNRKPFNSHKAIKENIDNIKSLEGFISIYSKIDTQKEALFFDKIQKIKTILHEIKTAYDERLTELGKIDFDTIITKTLEIIPHAKTCFKYIMVDEFQDTNETQFAIVKSSMGKDTNLFVVGDSKQSIYSFQGAEIEVFNNAVEDTSLFSSIELMSKNHRSDGVVLSNVNKIFNTLLAKDSHLKHISQNYEATPQELEVFKKKRADTGSFKFLITAQAYQEEVNEMDTIASFIEEVCDEKLSEYEHISKRIKEKNKAIAIIFDSSTKMLELKLKLREKGITAKVSASDNFYHTKEVNDVFNTLKAVYILSKKPEVLTASQKYFVVAAMRSNILRVDDDTIKNHLESGTLPEQLSHLVERYFHMPLSEFVKYMYDSFNLFGVYTHLSDVEQRVANLYKFLELCKEYQSANESDLYKFLSLLENSIYFSEAKENEAFFKSENSRSIEICSIHSTKGLAYPLVLLANSEKALYSQITSDALKHNNFTLDGEKKEIVGFKINSYEPASLRVLKQLDKLKHLAEKKRLLYVALTRAEHDAVISACLKQNKGGDISLSDDSYLAMMSSALGISKEQLFEQDAGYCIEHVKFQKREPKEKKRVAYSEHILEELAFESKEILSATSHAKTYDTTATKQGTITHKIFELYWESLEYEEHEKIFDKFEIYEESEQTKLKNSITKFLESELYTKLKSGVEHKFELEFHMPNKRGFIDLVYFDAEKNGWVIVDFKTGQQTKEKELGYAEQLAFYESVLVENGMNVVGKRLLWV